MQKGGIFHKQACSQPPLQVLDVARIKALGFFEIPDGRFQGTLQPFLYVKWCKYFNVQDRLPCGPGEHAATRRCVGILKGMGVEAVCTDPHEYPIMLSPSEVSSAVYLQHGWFTPRAGKPDFYWIDNMWQQL